MPKLKDAQAPKYRHHRPSNRAVVTFNGRDIYLGQYNSEESRSAYARLVAEWNTNQRHLPASATGQLLVDEIIARYWAHAERYYRSPDGSASSEIECLKPPLKLLRRMYGNTNADDFGPLKLDALRCEMIRIGWSRRSINRQIARIKRVFKWAASKEHVLPKVFHALSTVAGLEAGRSDARETDPIRPVSDEVIEATLPFLSSVVAAMVRVQRLSGCRPGELCILRTADIDTTGAVWMYTPQRHKNSYRGMARTIAFGPKAQAVLMPFLKPLNPQAYIFSPADSMAEMRERRHLARKTPVRQGNGIGTARKPEPKRTPGGRYDPLGYHTAIARACDKALPAPEPLCRHAKETASAWKARLTPEQQKELADWQRSHRWHPHQLRHSAASEIRKRFGLEGAQVVLGHASANVSEIYAERDGAAASRVALEVG